VHVHHNLERGRADLGGRADAVGTAHPPDTADARGLNKAGASLFFPLPAHRVDITFQQVHILVKKC